MLKKLATIFFIVFVFVEISGRGIIYLFANHINVVYLAPFGANINFIGKIMTDDPRLFTIKNDDLGFVINPRLNISYKPTEISKDVSEILYKAKDLFGDGIIGARDDGIDGKLWAIAIGDSYTFCYGVNLEDCWTEIVERELGLDVLNLGVPGYGTYQEYKILSIFLKRYKEKPKYVFLMVNYTDYLDDMCFLERENCNIFSPNTVFLKKNGFLGHSVILGFFKTIFEMPTIRLKYKKLMEPNLEYILSIKHECSCRLVLIFAYNVPGRKKPCSYVPCVFIKYESQMFMGNHHSVYGQKYIAEHIIKFLKEENIY